MGALRADRGRVSSDSSSDEGAVLGTIPYVAYLCGYHKGKSGAEMEQKKIYRRGKSGKRGKLPTRRPLIKCIYMGRRL